MAVTSGFVVFLVCFSALEIAFCVWMAAMWQRRNDMLVRARSPPLCFASGVANMAYLAVFAVQECMRQLELDFPCWVMMWGCYSLLPIMLMPMPIRALRVITLTRQEWRAKYLRYVDWRGQAAVIAGSTALFLCIALGLQLAGVTTESQDYCLAYMPWQFWFSVLVATAFASAALFKLLRDAKDTLDIGGELVRVMGVNYAFAIPYFILVAAAQGGALALDTRAHYLLACMHVHGMWDTFVRSRRMWGKAWSSTAASSSWGGGQKAAGSARMHVSQRLLRSIRIGTSSTALEEGSGPGAAFLREKYKQKERWCSSQEIMESPVMSAAFAEHVERSMCFESYKFLMEVTDYMDADFKTVEEQHAALDDLLQDFILPSSRWEVNISSRLKHQALALRSLDAFKELSPEERRNALKPHANEIAHMLDQNLLASFKKTKMYADAVAVETFKEASSGGHPLLLRTRSGGRGRTPPVSPRGGGARLQLVLPKAQAVAAVNSPRAAAAAARGSPRAAAVAAEA